jgi:hypothetical protein
MKTVIGDIHGRDFWKKTLEDSRFSDIYCVGDYWDTHEDISYTTQAKNFREIVEAAKRDSRLHLCIGNHDLHYIAEGEEYSIFQWKRYKTINHLLLEAMPLLRVAYEADGWVISHAGFSKTFMQKNGCLTIADVQQRFDADFSFLGFNLDSDDTSGDDPCQGPLWIRPVSLFDDMFFPKQIVGHTPFANITGMELEGERLVFVDTNGTGEAFVFD